MRMRRLVTVLEAAEAIGCDANHVYYLLNMGTLFAFKVRWIYRIDSASVEDYAARRFEKGIARLAPRYSGCPGYLFNPAGLAENGDARDHRAEASGLPGGRRLEREPDRLPHLPQPSCHPVAARPRPVQYVLAIA
jgi:hypothetical protein